MKLDTVDPRVLLEFLGQQPVYGETGGEHDEDFLDLVENVREVGVLVPIAASKGTPGVPDGTVISGHRRRLAAMRAGLGEVPVIWTAYPSHDHAALAHLDCNRNRAKDQWVKTQEAAAYWAVEVKLAARRQAEGLKQNSDKARPGNRAGTEHADTRDAVAAKVGVSGKTAELMVKLASKAKEQNPEHPEASPVAERLRAGSSIASAAREYGLLSPAATKLTEPNDDQVVEQLFDLVRKRDPTTEQMRLLGKRILASL